MGIPATDMFGKPWPTNPAQDALQKRLGGTGQKAPAGYDQKNWDDPNMDSVKYAASRPLYGKSRPSEVAAIVAGAEYQKRFPGATFDGKDRVNFRGALSDGARGGVPVYEIDVLKNANRESDTSDGLWWGHDVAGMNQGPAPRSTTMPVSAPVRLGQQSDLMAQILAALQEPLDPQGLLQQVMR